MKLTTLTKEMAVVRGRSHYRCQLDPIHPEHAELGNPHSRDCTPESGRLESQSQLIVP